MSKEEILELLDELVARIEGPAKEVFDLAVRSVWTGAVLTILACVAALVGLGVFFRHARREYQKGVASFDEAQAKYEKERVRILALPVDSHERKFSYLTSPSRYSHVDDDWLMRSWMAAGVSVIPIVVALFALHDLLNAGFVALRMIVPGL